MMNAIENLKHYFTDDVKKAVDALGSNPAAQTPSANIAAPKSFSIHSLGALRPIFAAGYERLPEIPRPSDIASESRREVQVVFATAGAKSEPQWVQEIIEGVVRDILMIEKTTISDTELIVHLAVPSAGSDRTRLQKFLRNLRSRIRSSLKVHILELVGKNRTLLRVDLEDIVIHEDEDLPSMVGALCQGLRFNHVMKDLSLAQKDIGDTGFQHLAEMLLVNGSLEHLNLRGTGMFPVHLGQIASALERNISLSLTLSSLVLGDNPGLLAHGDGSHAMRRILQVSKSLKKLDLRDTGAAPEAVEDIALALSSSTSLQSLVLAQNEMGREDFKALADMMAVNASLEELNLSESGMLSEDLGHMISALVNNHNRCLKVWILGQNPDLLADDNGVHMSHLLDVVTSLQELDLSNTGLNKRGQNVAMMSLGLKFNTSLRKLNVGGNRIFGKEGGKHLGEVLRFNSGLQELGLSHTTGTWTWRNDDSMYGFCEGLECNTSLKRLDFSHNVPSLKLFKSLEKNKSLTCLNMELCDFDRNVSLQAIGRMLDRNLTLTELRLDNSTGLEDTDLARVQLKLDANAACASSKKLMLSMNTAKPKFARVVLCGFPYAGKTSLRLSMLKSRRQDKLSHTKTMVMQVRRLSEYIWKRRWMKMLWADKKAVVAPTSGVDIQILEEDAKMTLSVWDLAGQEENPSFHEHLLLNFLSVGTTSAFVIVCNLCKKQDGQDMDHGLCKSAEDVQEECEHWFKLLASNTKRRPVSEVRPRVIIVLNKKNSKTRRSTRALTELISTAVVSMRKQFESYLDIVLREKDDVEVMDVWSVTAVTPFTKSLVRTTRKVLSQDALQPPEVPSASENLSIAITKWMIRHPSRPIISWDKFERLCQVKNIFEDLSSGSSKSKEPVEVLQKRCRAVARHVHDSGQIIYFDDLEIVVINPRWFCHCFLGRLIPSAAGSDPSDTSVAIGVTTARRLESLFFQSLEEFSYRKQDKLQAILPGYKLIQLMLRLELCFESGSEGDMKLYSLPATLPLNDDAETGSRPLQWPLRTDSDRPLGYLGRRLVCRDQICTILTPGFFPRLQVHLHNRFAKLRGFDRTLYKVERNLISVSFGGVDYLVEYSPFDNFVDILVRYPVEASDTMLQVCENVIRPIQEFCASRAGCQGVDLVEGVIRTSSVEKLDLCQDRRNQSALVSELVQDLKVYGPERRHEWPKDVEGSEDSEYILLLLGKEDLKRESDKWFKGLEDAAQDLQENFINQRHPQPNLDGFSADFKDTVSRIPESEGRIFSSIAKKLHQMKLWQGMLLDSVSLRLDRLNNFTAQLQNRQFPKLAYFTVPDVNKVRQIVTEITPQLTMVQVHYMCEALHRGRPHIVPKQPGRQLTVISETLEPWWPYLAGALAVLDVMVKTGAQKLISSAITPTFSTRAYWKDKDFWEGVGKPDKAPPEWLVDFLTGPGPLRIYDDFMLHKVRYGKSQQTAWICDHHMRRGMDAGILTVLDHEA